MVELSTRKWEIGGNHHEKLGLKRISWASQLTIPDTAGTSRDPAHTNTDTRSSQPNQASRTPDFSYPLISSISFPSSSPIALFLVHNSTIIAEHNVKSSLSISPWHDHELTPSTASTQDCLSSLHSHDYELTLECSFSFQRTSLHDRPPSASSQWELKDKVTLSHSHGCELTNWWIESHHPVRRRLTVSKYSSNLARSRPPNASPNSLDHGLQVYLQTRSITACKFAQACPPSASPISLGHGLQVHLQTRSITASEYISEFTWLSFSGPPRIALQHRLQPVQI